MHETATSPAPSAGTRLGERVRSLRVVRRADADAARGRAVLEGVHQPDRARQDAPDRGDDRLAGRAARRRSGVPRVRASRRRSATKVEAQLERAEALSAAHSYEEAIEAFSEAARRPSRRPAPPCSSSARSRARRGRSRSRARCARRSSSCSARGRSSSARSSRTSIAPTCSSASAVCRYKLSSISTAVALFDEALELAERSGLPCGLLRSDILQWRSRCRRRLRDYVAARDDVERALELAQDLGDRAAIARAYFQASLDRPAAGPLRSVPQLRAAGEGAVPAAERRAQRRSAACSCSAVSRSSWETRSSAVEHLKASYSRALDADSPADAAQALEGIARVHLNRGEYDQADELARKSLALLQGREDYLHEVCPSQLVLGRALLERGRLDEAEECFRAADAAAEQMASISHRTEAWVALGDLAARRGDDREAARLYRNAAEALQEIRF